MRKMRFFGAALVAALAYAGSSLAATYSLHGSSRGVRLAEGVMNAFATLPGYTYTETQFFQMTTSRGKSPSFQYRFGYSSLPVGWSWASEKGAMGLSNNHIVWWRDDLTPAASKRAQPVEIVFNGNGKFWAFGSAAHHSCFRPLTAGSEMPYDRGFSVTGKVGAPRQQGGGLVSLTSTYPWGASGVATESDTVNASSHLVNSGVVTVGGHSLGFANFFTGPGAAPNVKLCK